MSRRRVVVTGIGMLSSLGNTVNETWDGIVNGRSGAALIDDFDTSTYSTRFAARVKNFDVTEYMAAKDARRMDVFIQYGIAAATQAIRDSGIEANEQNAHRIGVSIGSGIGGITAIENNHQTLVEEGTRKISPFFVPGSIINMISGNVSITYGFKGPNWAISTACTTATHCIGYAARCIAWGDADAMIAGGAEKASSPLGMAGFCAARALSSRNDDPTRASRPWDKSRDGFVLGDGAGVLVLEEYEFAKKRGAKIYAELIGFGVSGDAFHITAPPDTGEGAALAMKNALNDAQINPDQVSYVNAHGTSTLVGDLAETNAILSTFGNSALKLPVSSTKSMVGHLLGAAGAVEAVFSILSIRDQIAPPTINLDEPDEGCVLDYVPHTARRLPIDIVVSNSFGFGGTNGSLVFRKV